MKSPHLLALYHMSNKWGAVHLGWIFIFPLPLTILLLRKKDMKPVIKYGIIAAAWILFLALAVSSKGSTDALDADSSQPSDTSYNTSESLEPVSDSQPVS